MSDLIKRSDAIKAVRNTVAQYVPFLNGINMTLPLECETALRSVPSADRPQGEWIAQNENYHSHWVCSECGAWALLEYNEQMCLSNFCPDCGARMFAKDTNVPNKKKQTMSEECRIYGDDYRWDDEDYGLTEGWIPCSERLPRKNGTYLVTFEWTGKTGNKYIEIEGIDFERGRWGCHDYEKVTAWMPLPKPYREREGE